MPSQAYLDWTLGRFTRSPAKDQEAQTAASLTCAGNASHALSHAMAYDFEALYALLKLLRVTRQDVR